MKAHLYLLLARFSAIVGQLVAEFAVRRRPGGLGIPLWHTDAVVKLAIELVQRILKLSDDVRHGAHALIKSWLDSLSRFGGRPPKLAFALEQQGTAG